MKGSFRRNIYGDKCSEVDLFGLGFFFEGFEIVILFYRGVVR